MAALGVSQHKDVASFCLALAVDPIVSIFEPGHDKALITLGACLNGASALEELHRLFRHATEADDADADL